MPSSGCSTLHGVNPNAKTTAVDVSRKGLQVALTVGAGVGHMIYLKGEQVRWN